MRNTTLLSVLFYIFSINVVGAAFNIVKSLEEKFFADVFPEIFLIPMRQIRKIC
jgi:hypothetical protein